MHRAILQLASWLVPCDDRREWLREWTAELWYAGEAGVNRTTFCAGAIQDACWLRARRLKADAAGLLSLRGHLQCLGALGLVAAAIFLATFLLPGPRHAIASQPILAHIFVLAVALAILPSTGIVWQQAPASAPRWWLFLGAKSALVIVAVFFGTFGFGPLISNPGLQPQAALVGYVVVLRWALDDQRKRCRVCLRSLTSPVKIGQVASTLLDWYGTELICGEGHGVLQVPELEHSSYCVSRWLRLDA